MHPLKDDPLYKPCQDVIEKYVECNDSTMSRLRGDCNSLFESMTSCMRQQRRLKKQMNAQLAKERTLEIEKIKDEYNLEWWK
ncbi:hypothetical protein MIR68_002553 [Amoeboaphelidium protococcarum]|nr:hypothetical protein MIR68_002553 [Amoeboaphelidium protococcarum]